MITGRNIEFDLSLNDTATPKYNKFVDEVKAGAAEVGNNVKQSSRAFEEHGKHVGKVTEFYKEQRSENRLQSFYFREGTQAINALSFGMMAFMSSQDSANESTQKMNKSLMQGFMAFQGIEFMLSALGAGAWGLVVAGIAGVAVAISKITAGDNTDQLKKTADALQKIGELKFKLSGLTMGEKEDYGSDEAAAYEALLMNTRIVAEKALEEAKIKAIKSVGTVIENGQWKIKTEYDETNKGYLSAVQAKLEAEVAYYNYIDKRQEYFANKIFDTNEEEGARLNNLYEEEKKLDDIRDENFVKTLKQSMELSKAGFAAESKRFLGTLPEPSTDVDKEKFRQYQETMQSISQMERQAFRENKDYELRVVDNWLEKVKNTYGTTQDDITRAEQIAVARRSQIELQSFQRTFTQYSSQATRAFSLMQRASNQKYDSQIDDLERKKDAELEGIDEALKNENLSAEQRKKLEADKAAITKKYAAEEAAIKTQQWQAEKEANIAMAVIEGAEAVVKALPNIPLAIIAGAMAAAEIAIMAGQTAPKFHTGGEMGYYGERRPLQNDERTAILKVGETVRTREQESNLQRRGNTFHFHFPGVVTNEEGVVTVIKKALEKSGFNSLTDLITNDRHGYSFGTV